MMCEPLFHSTTMWPGWSSMRLTAPVNPSRAPSIGCCGSASLPPLSRPRRDLSWSSRFRLVSADCSTATTARSPRCLRSWKGRTAGDYSGRKPVAVRLRQPLRPAAGSQPMAGRGLLWCGHGRLALDFDWRISAHLHQSPHRQRDSHGEGCADCRGVAGPPLRSDHRAG